MLFPCGVASNSAVKPLLCEGKERLVQLVSLVIQTGAGGVLELLFEELLLDDELFDKEELLLEL